MIAVEPLPDLSRIVGAAEARLVRRRKTPEGGVELVLELHPDDSAQPVVTEPRGGDRFLLALVRLADDDRPLDEGMAPANRDAVMRRWFALPPVTQACVLCADVRFRWFLKVKCGFDVPEAADAATYVRALCGVTSRAEILEGTEAGDRWAALWREYHGWLDTIRRGDV